MPSKSVPLVQLEIAAFAIQRRLATYAYSESDLLSAAQRLITEAIEGNRGEEEDDDSLWEASNSRKLDSAARIGSSLSRVGVTDGRSSQLLRLLVIIAFCIDGNHASGRLLGTELLAEDDLSEELRVILAIACPSIARRCLPSEPANPASRPLVMLAASVASLEAVDPQVITSALVQYVHDLGVNGLGYLAHLAIRSLNRTLELRFDQVLAGRDFPLAAALIDGMSRAGLHFALPSQEAALKQDGILGSAEPSLVCLPTGAGKTLVGLIALASVIRDASDCVVFLAPYLAIRRQVQEAAKRLLESHLDVDDAWTVKSSATRPSLVVDTPESFDARLRSDPTLLWRLRGIVLDEAHILASGHRGVLVDALLTRLTMSGADFPRPKLVLLSALLEEDVNVSAWLRRVGTPSAAVSRWRPSARRLAVWRKDGRLEWIRTLAPRARGAVALKLAEGRVEPAHPQLSPGNRFRPPSARLQQCDENVALLATALHTQDQLPTLIITGSRSRARSVARSLAERLAERPPEFPRVASLIETVIGGFPECSDLIPLLQRGVAYHTAGLPPRLRVLVEETCAAGELSFVSSTTSLAEGADLPFGRTILADWTFPVGPGEYSAFAPALWRNIAGRCGRPTSHIEGETIIVEETPPLAFASAAAQWEALRQMLTSEVRIECSLGSGGDLSPLGLERLLQQALAAIGQFEGQEEVHRVFIDGLLAVHVGGDTVRILARSSVEGRLFGGPFPLARRNSPVALTSYGRSFSKCAVLPETAERLAALLTAPFAAEDTAALCSEVLAAVAECIELSQTALAKVLRGETVQGLWLRSEHVAHACRRWLEGAPATSILIELAEMGRHGTPAKRTALRLWVQGASSEDQWHRYLESLGDFIQSVLSEFLPRALSSMVELRTLVTPEPGWERALPVALDQVNAAARRWRDAEL